MIRNMKIKLLLAMLLAPMVASAFSVKVGDVKVEFKVLDDEKHLVQVGEGTKNRPAVAVTTPGTLNIPETVRRNSTIYTVAAIGDYAFYGCTELRTVTIPATVTSIGSYAFNMSGIESFRIPDAVETIGTAAFGNELVDEDSGLPFLQWISVSPFNKHYCSLDGVLYKSNGGAPACLLCYPPANEAKRFMLPLTVTEIGEMAFSVAWQLERITLHNDVTAIGKNAFQYCVGLKSIRMPLTMSGEIPEYAFFYCVALTDINLPDGIESIGESAFRECYNLERVVFPVTLTNIAAHAFYEGHVLDAKFLNPIPPAYGKDVFTTSVTGGQPTFYIPQGEDLDTWPEDIFDTYFPAAGHIWNDYSGISVWGFEDDEDKEMLLNLYGIKYDLLSNSLVFTNCSIHDTQIPTGEGSVDADDLGINDAFLTINDDLIGDLYLRFEGGNFIYSRHGFLRLVNNKKHNVVIEGDGQLGAVSSKECALLMYGDSQLDLLANYLSFKGLENAAWSNWSSTLNIGGPQTSVVNFEPLDSESQADDQGQALRGFGEINVYDGLFAGEGMTVADKVSFAAPLMFGSDDGGFVRTEDESTSEGAVALVESYGFVLADEPAFAFNRDKLPGGATFDKATRTLHLNNVELSSDNMAIARIADKPLRIYVTGTNLLRTKETGIYTAVINSNKGGLTEGREPIAFEGDGHLVIVGKQPLSLMGESPVMFNCGYINLYGKKGMVSTKDDMSAIYQYCPACFVVVDENYDLNNIDADTPYTEFMTVSETDVFKDLPHFYLMDSSLEVVGPDGPCHYSEDDWTFVYDEDESPVCKYVFITKNETTTGIGNEELRMKHEESGMQTQAFFYNLQGQHVGKDYRGIVLNKGRKYIKK